MCNPADEPTNRQPDTGENLTFLEEVMSTFFFTKKGKKKPSKINDAAIKNQNIKFYIFFPVKFK